MPEMIDTPVTLADFSEVIPADRELYLCVVGEDGEEGRVRIDAAFQLLESGDLPDIPAAAIAAALAAATDDDALEDTSEVVYLDGVEVKRSTLVGLISSIFKVSRTIANAQFASATFKLFNAAGTPRALTFNTTALTADRVITVPDVAVDLANVGPRLGVGQTWQDVSASRFVSTWYLNSTGRPIMVAISAITTTTRAVQVSPDGGTAILEVGRIGTTSNGNQLILPAGWSYRIDGSLTAGYTILELK